jgi:hypothetical protein
MGFDNFYVGITALLRGEVTHISITTFVVKYLPGLERDGERVLWMKNLFFFNLK